MAIRGALSPPCSRLISGLFAALPPSMLTEALRDAERGDAAPAPGGKYGKHPNYGKGARG